MTSPAPAVRRRPTQPIDIPYTVAQAAPLLQITEPTLREWLREGRVRGINLGAENGTGRRWRIPHSEIVRLTR